MTLVWRAIVPTHCGRDCSPLPLSMSLWEHRGPNGLPSWYWALIALIADGCVKGMCMCLVCCVVCMHIYMYMCSMCTWMVFVHVCGECEYICVCACVCVCNVCLYMCMHVHEGLCTHNGFGPHLPFFFLNTGESHPTHWH